MRHVLCKLLSIFVIIMSVPLGSVMPADVPPENWTILG